MAAVRYLAIISSSRLAEKGVNIALIWTVYTLAEKVAMVALAAAEPVLALVGADINLVAVEAVRRAQPGTVVMAAKAASLAAAAAAAGMARNIPPMAIPAVQEARAAQAMAGTEAHQP